MLDINYFSTIGFFRNFFQIYRICHRNIRKYQDIHHKLRTFMVIPNTKIELIQYVAVCNKGIEKNVISLGILCHALCHSFY